MLKSCSLFQTLFAVLIMRRWKEEEVSSDDVRLFVASHPITGIGETPDIPKPEPDMEEEDDTLLLSWKQILRLLTRWDPFIRYSAWLHHIHLAMDNPTTAHKMLVMCQPERNILNDLRQIVLAEDMDIPNSHVDTTKQRFITLCNTVRTVPLIGMSYPLQAVLNVVDLL